MQRQGHRLCRWGSKLFELWKRRSKSSSSGKTCLLRPEQMGRVSASMGGTREFQGVSCYLIPGWQVSSQMAAARPGNLPGHPQHRAIALGKSRQPCDISYASDADCSMLYARRGEHQLLISARYDSVIDPWQPHRDRPCNRSVPAGPSGTRAGISATLLKSWTASTRE